MQQNELTFLRAIKVWWSYAWRMFVLCIPLLFVYIAILGFLIKGMPSPGPGEKPQLPLISIWITYAVMIPSSIVLQIVSLRWALKTRWSDFYLEIRPSGSENKI